VGDVEGPHLVPSLRGSGPLTPSPDDLRRGSRKGDRTYWGRGLRTSRNSTFVNGTEIWGKTERFS